MGQINLNEGWKAQRVWASYWRGECNCIIEVNNENGTEYYSIGETEFGMLGQGSNEKGDKIKESKAFSKLEISDKDTKFKQISLGGSHALAIDQNDQLWAWGCNSSFQTGIQTETEEGFFKPTKVPFVETLKLKVLKVDAGKSHSLIQAVDENGKKKMFSLGGRNESMFRFLGVSKELAAGEQPYHEIIAFSELDVLDFSATRDHSMIIMAGEEKPTDNLYVHKLPGGEAQGLIHFYQNEDGSWTYLSE